MDTARFSSEMPGHLVRTTSMQWAFVPNPLPPILHWTPALVRLISESDRSIGRLWGLGAGELGGFSPNVFIRPFVRREAVLSSRIEGTKASLSELMLFEDAADAAERTAPDVREVANYVRALEFGQAAVGHRGLTVSLIKELHQSLMEGVHGGHALPGAFRREQVFIGSSRRIEQARYVPPPATEVDRLMAELETYLSRPSDLPPLIRVALVHYYFEAVHPFRDGNGRVGRLLMTLMLSSAELLPVPMLYLSAYLERNRAEYYGLLLEVSQKAAWNEWVEFVLRGVVEEAADAVERAGRLMSLRSRYLVTLQATRAPAAAIKLIDSLFADPIVTARHAAATMGLTAAATQTHLNRLIAAGILRETTGGKRNRIYVATGILELLEEERREPGV